MGSRGQQYFQELSRLNAVLRQRDDDVAKLKQLMSATSASASIAQLTSPSRSAPPSPARSHGVPSTPTSTAPDASSVRVGASGTPNRGAGAVVEEDLVVPTQLAGLLPGHNLEGAQAAASPASPSVHSQVQRASAKRGLFFMLGGGRGGTLRRFPRGKA